MCFLPIRGEDGCFLYGVFNGYDGSKVASFASQCLTAELLLGQINSSHTDNDIRRILSQVFPNLNDRTFTLVILVMYVKHHSWDATANTHAVLDKEQQEDCLFTGYSLCRVISVSFTYMLLCVAGLWCGGEELFWDHRWCFGWKSKPVQLSPATQWGTQRWKLERESSLVVSIETQIWTLVWVHS